MKDIDVDDKLVSSSIPIELKPKDIPILSGAIAQKCTHLLTGDKKILWFFDFLYGKQVENVLIVSPKLLAEEMVAKGWIERKWNAIAICQFSKLPVTNAIDIQL